MIFPEFSRLKAPLGVYGSLGNHDHYMTDQDHRLLQQTIRNNGIRLLVNEHTALTSGGDKLYIAGIDNTGSRQKFGDVNKTLNGIEQESPVILLAHDPTVWDKEIRGQQPIDVMLSGHTHGGQFVIDVLGEELSPARAVYKQWAGFYDDTTTKQVLYVNRGMGTTGIPMRLGIPPELTLVTLQRA
jgi:predicted MPP superfamily phosphohydrolase